MKADPEVKMISAEAPILFAKGCDIFITELTMRAWIHAEENKRRTLQRSDIASALAKSDMFDFLIDIVPREEAAAHNKRTTTQPGSSAQTVPPTGQSQIPGQHSNMAQPQNHSSSHPMGPTDYIGGHALGPDQDYRQNPNMYTGQVAANPSAAYGQAQPPNMYGEMEGMYPYSAMQAQQVCRDRLLPGLSSHCMALTRSRRQWLTRSLNDPLVPTISSIDEIVSGIYWVTMGVQMGRHST